MLKKILMASLLSTGIYAQAENNISYNYLELGFDYVDLQGQNHADGFYLNGSFDLNDSWYMGGYIDRDSVHELDFDQLGIFVGFHKSMSTRTDFYTELDLGRVDVANSDSTTYGISVGTRTAFTDKFELISKFGYTHNNRFDDGFFKVGVKGLFKFNESHAITLGVENYDFDDVRASIGYRYTF